MKSKILWPNVYSIQVKIELLSLAIAVCTTILSLVISYYAEINTIKSTTESYMTEYISEADQNFHAMIEEAQKVSLSIAMEREIIYPVIMDKSPEASYEKYQQMKKIKSFFSGLMTNKEYIEDILLVTQEMDIYQSGPDLFIKKDLENPWMEKILSSEKGGLRYNPDGNQVFYSGPVVYKGSGKIMNLIKLDYEILTGAYNTELLQNANILIFMPDETLFFSNAEWKGSEKEVFEQVKYRGKYSGYISLEKERYYFIQYYSDKSKMTTIGFIPYNTLLTEADALREKFVMIGVFVSIFSFALARFLSQRLCQNLQRLTRTMEEVRRGKLEVKADVASKDEIGKLADTFNEMMERIKQLLGEVKEKERLKLEAEQAILATQIEPHFLYNSIDSIQHIAHMRGEKEIEQISVALSELLRSVLNNKDEFITLWEEREYIENYMSIERFKCRNECRLLWDVDEELWSWRLPKLLLQPIVENAFVHGISGREEGGAIHVKIFRQGKEVICKVTDNGKGMSQKKIECLLAEISKKDKTGFRRVGIANVFGRIKLIYGEPYGGTIHTCEGMFTCVELHLPEKSLETEENVNGL